MCGSQSLNVDGSRNVCSLSGGSCLSKCLMHRQGPIQRAWVPALVRVYPMSVLAETCMCKDAPGSAVYNGKNRKKNSRKHTCDG